MSGKRYNIPDREEIVKEYSKYGSTISSLARKYSTSNATVRSWLKKYNIDIKPHSIASKEANSLHKNNVKPSKEEFENLYNRSNIKELERYYKVSQSTIYEWIDLFCLERRSHSESCQIGKNKQFSSIRFSKEFLENEYASVKTKRNLAEKLNVSNSYIKKLFTEYSIETKEDSVNRSKAENDLFNFVVSNFPNDDIESNNRSIIYPYELDIVNHTKKIAIEYCGIYWHSEYSSGKPSNYHFKKFKECKDKGYKLITVFETDDIEKIKSLILKVMGKTDKRIYARKTTIKEISVFEAREFHEKYHLHGFVGAKYHYGLFYNNEIVMACSFGKNRFSKNQDYECTRMSSIDNTVVVGGVSKLFNHFIKTKDPNSIVTFADLRFGDGGCYKYCGFEFEGYTPQNYWYTYKYILELHSRVKFQKHKLSNLLENFDENKTEFENMIDDNWDRIWDCGDAKYVYEKGPDQ